MRFGDHTLSMAAAACNAGVGERTNAVHQELLEKSRRCIRSSYEANVNSEEERILKEIVSKVRELQLSRGERPRPNAGLLRSSI